MSRRHGVGGCGADIVCRTKVNGTWTISKAGGIAPSKLASLQEDDRASNKDEKEGSDSGGSGGGSDERDDGGESCVMVRFSTRSSRADEHSRSVENEWQSCWDI